MSTLLTKLMIITVSAFTFSLVVNMVLGGNPFNRIGFAVFVSVLPGIISFILFRVGRLVATWQRLVTVYLFLFGMTIVVQGVLR